MAPPNNYQVFFRNHGSTEWNNDPTADPVAVVGGIDISAMAGTPMLPTVQATGEGQMTANFGATGFLDAPPSGYTAGWPGSAGGFTTLDPAKLFGTASLSGGNLIMNVGFAPGMAQAVDAYTAGQYYFELTFSGGAIFAGDMGGGVGANYNNGGSFDFWLASCAFNSGLPNGGTGVISDEIFALNQAITSWSFPKFTTVGVAVFLSSGVTPPAPIQQPVPQSLHRWRGAVGVNWMGMALVGDAFTNVVGLQDFENFTEYGNVMEFQITTPPIHDDRKRIFMPRFEIEVESGDGLSATPATPPLMTLEWSKDGGITWSTLQLPRSMGLIGEYINRLRWINLGNSRTWVFRLTCTDPVRRYVIGAYADYYKSLG